MRAPAPAPILVLAVGNESRGDDALGPLLLRALEQRLTEEGLGAQVEFIEEFQLQVEHTLDIAGRTLVLFIDAGHRTMAPYRFYRAEPRRLDGHTSHAVAIETLLGVFDTVHGTAAPPTFVLCVAGESFELGVPPSANSVRHLAAALDFSCRLFECADPATWHALAQEGAV